MSFSGATRVVKLFFDNRPFLSNCLNYGAMAGLAEFTQQTIERKIGLGVSEAQTTVSKLEQLYCMYCKKYQPSTLA